jgi:hypothetical protein
MGFLRLYKGQKNINLRRNKINDINLNGFIYPLMANGIRPIPAKIKKIIPG